MSLILFFFFFQAEDGIRDVAVTGVQTCALPISGITFLHIVLGELTPKSLALLHPERISRWMAPPLLLFTEVFWPAIWLLNKSAAGVLHLFAVRPPAHAERVHDPEELLLLLSESRKHGLVEESN